MMNAHFCAAAPNLRIMEIDPDTVPWYDDLVVRAHPPLPRAEAISGASARTAGPPSAPRATRP